MKKQISTFVFLVMLLLVGPALAEPMPVAVGIPPMKYFVEKIGGPHVAVTTMVPAGSDAHTYEPKPSQLKVISKAPLYFAVGLEFEKAWVPRFQAANPKLKVIQTDAGIEKLTMAAHQHHHEEGHHVAKHEDHHDEVELDAHVWVAPSQVKIISQNIVKALSEADPNNAKVYQTNLTAFLQDIDKLDREIRSVFVGVPKDKRRFMVFHPAWGYFAKAYDLTQIAVEVEGKEPKLKALQGLIAEAKKEGVKVIFVQPQFSTKSAQAIAQAINGQVVVADPLAEDWPGNLRRVAEAFRKALK